MKKLFRLAALSSAIAFVAMNVIAALHAYKFTHFVDSSQTRTEVNEHTSVIEKIKLALAGVSNPRPRISAYPDTTYTSLTIPGTKKTYCWEIHTSHPKGTVVLFHGYVGNKSLMLDKGNYFLKMGFNVLLADFMGSGESEGNQTTIGFYEAQQVADCFNYLRSKQEKNIFLFGTSMGAAAILKAVADYGVDPSGIIIECPFGSLYQTVCARFKSFGLPTFPMAGLLVAWGGLENNFWAFGHRPIDYASKVTCPTLLFYGERDEKVSREETDQIFQNLRGQKKLVTFPFAGHENYLLKYAGEWSASINIFLEQVLKDGRKN